MLLIFLASMISHAQSESSLKYETLSSKELIKAEMSNKIESMMLRVPLEQVPESSFDESGKVTVFLDMPTSLMTRFYLIDEETNVVKERQFLSGGLNVNQDGPGFVPSLTLTKEQAQDHSLIISVEKPLLLSISFSSLPFKEFRSYEGKKISYALIYIGGAIAIGIFILIFGIILKDLSFIYYFLFLFFITPSSSDVRGVLNYLSSGALIYTPYIREISFNLSFAFCLLFTNEYFKIKKNSKKLFYAVVFGIVLFFLRSTVLVLDQMFTLNIAFYLLDSSLFHFLFLVAISLFSAMYFYKTRPRESVVYLVTWGAFFFFAIIWLMALTGVIQFSYWMNGLIYLGFIFQSLILMYGVWLLNHKKEISDLKASESQKLKNLIRVLCHDSINLLNVALAQSENFKGSNADIESHKVAWEKVNVATKDQLELLSHIREMDALESGKRVFDLSGVDINSLIHKSKLIFENNLKKKDIELSLFLDSEIDHVLAEKVSLSNNVLNNLVSNAIKFSNTGSSIIIRSFMTETHVVVTVKDCGVGIPKKILDDLFNPSAKTTRKGTNNESGTGFGMPLVKSTMDAYGAEIEVESKEGESSGTLFRLSFQKSDVTRIHKKTSLNFDKRVLIVDDDEGIQDLCRLWLKSSSVSFDIYSSFEEAAMSEDLSAYDICFVDKNLETEDGLECIKNYISDHPDIDSKFIIMSADIISLDSEIIGYLGKPLSKEKLLESIGTA